jgi:adenosine kinase
MAMDIVITIALLGTAVIASRSSDVSHLSSVTHTSALFFGNPFLDLTKHTGVGYILQHSLSPAAEVFQLAESSHSAEVQQIFASFESDPLVEKLAGGASQNSARVMSLLSRALGEESESKITYTGSVGDDEVAQCMRISCIESGVEPCYQVSNDRATGKCAAMFYNESEETLAGLGQFCDPAGRTVASCLNAAAHFDDSLEDSFLEKFDMFYTEGFFIFTSLNTLLRAARHAHANNKPFIINLSSQTIYPYAYEGLMQLLPYASVVFGNEAEFPAVGDLMVSRGDVVAPAGGFTLESVAQHLGTMQFHGVPARARTVVITRGTDPAVVYNPLTATVAHFPIFKLKNAEMLKDTTAAGDSFVGGFLSGLATGKPLEECMQRAALAAGIIVQMRGCSFPKTEEEFHAIVENLEAPQELISNLAYPAPIVTAASATA